MEVADYDGDGRDELRLGYLSYAGGSGGTRWSVIYDLKDGALTAHSGYPEMLDIDVARFIRRSTCTPASTAPCHATSVSWKTWSAEAASASP